MVVASLLLPTVAAWQLPAAAPPSDAQPASSAWTTWMSPTLHRTPGGAAAVAGSLQASAACALGDVTGDGVADLVVQAKGAVDGTLRLQALAGPDFTTTIWAQVGSAQRILSCAPDIDLDGSADALLQLTGEATSAAAAAGATAQGSTQQAMQVVSGATGALVMARTAADTATGAGQAAAGAALGAGSQATSVLLPAAAGAAAFVQSQVTQAAVLPASLPVPGLPIAGLTATAQSSVHAVILDAQGEVASTIDISDPATQVLALAPVPLGGGLPDVAVLTQQAVSPVQEVAMQIPSLALYNVDGSLAWSTQLTATASGGLPILLPQAGDVNLDGIPDLIVNTVETGVQAAPSAGFTVLSGLDGSVLVTSGEAARGLVAAVPLGMLPTGDALVQVEAATGSATMTISAITGTGTALWTATVDATAEPLNAALDAYTGDITGFTDLTGDQVPDVGVLVQGEAGTAFQVLDGVTGQVAWNATVKGVLGVVPLAQDTVRGRIHTAVDGASTDLLLVVDTAASAAASAQATAEGTLPAAAQPALVLLDGATGKVEWTVSAATDAGSGAVAVAVQAAGDLDADGVQDVLATFMPAVTAAGSASGGTGGSASAEASAQVDSSVVALSGRTGATLYVNGTGAAPLSGAAALSVQAGPAYEGAEASVPEATGAASSPAPVAGLLAVLLVALAGGSRRRRMA